jgi:hypothetical protein
VKTHLMEEIKKIKVGMDPEVMAGERKHSQGV